jgi:hypothetical protein
MTRGSADVADRVPRGILDTSVYIDIHALDPGELPKVPEITTVTLAELHQGVVMAKEPTDRPPEPSVWPPPQPTSTRFLSTSRQRRATAAS